MLYDRAEKQRRGYIENNSVVRQDGSEELVGLDWRNRKRELWERAGGKCEYVSEIPYDDAKQEPIRCNKPCDDPHHVVARWRHRDDRLVNLQALCRYHHRLVDGRKIGGRK